ncbi:MAG: anti-sigma F factor [Firmicutes bacterium]|nr:anti-sigma F factor [Bacillota bacterium]
MTIKNQMKIEFLSIPENVAFSRVVVASFAAQLDFTLNDLEEIKVATSEAVSNSIIHGYENQPIGMVRIKATIDDRTLEIIVEDDGKGIADIELATQPAYSSDPERMGLGFVFMKSFMDQIEVTSEVNKGTQVRLIKSLPASSASSTAEN